jgi:hypothetical protein
LHRGDRDFPAAHARQVVGGSGIEEEGLGSFDEEPFAFGRRRERLRLLHFVPPALEVGRTWPRWPQRLEERHRDTPMRHCATRVCLDHLPERFACLRIRHVMQQGDGTNELRLRVPGASREIDFAELRRSGVMRVVRDARRRHGKRRQRQRQRSCDRACGDMRGLQSVFAAEAAENGSWRHRASPRVSGL